MFFKPVPNLNSKFSQAFTNFISKWYSSTFLTLRHFRHVLRFQVICRGTLDDRMFLKYAIIGGNLVFY